MNESEQKKDDLLVLDYEQLSSASENLEETKKAAFGGPQ